MLFRTALSTAVILGISCALLFADNQTLDVLFRDYLSDLEHNNSRVGLVIYDLKEKKMIIDHHSEHSFPPASLAKLVITAVSLREFGPDFRFQTRIVSDGTVNSGVLKGSLVIVGSGDPSLNTLSLSDLARQVKSAGIRRIEGDLVFDDTLFGPSVPKGWPENTKADANFAPSCALSLNYNTVLVNIVERPDGTTAIQFEPQDSITRLINNLRTGRAISLKWTTNGWLIASGRLGSDKQYERRISVETPSFYTCTVLRNQLELAGVHVDGDIHRGTAPSNARVVAQWYSEPLTEMLAKMNEYSNNFIAEQVRRTLEARTNTSIQTLAASMFENAGIDNGKVVLVDGSGLSSLNRITPRTMADLLIAASTGEEGPDFFRTIARLDENPIYRNWGVHVNTEADIRVKSGRLPETYNMAGFVGDRDSGLVFVFMMETAAISEPTIKQVTEDVINRLVRLL